MKLNLCIFACATLCLLSFICGTYAYKYYFFFPLEKVVCQEKCDLYGIRGRQLKTYYKYREKVDLVCDCD